MAKFIMGIGIPGSGKTTLLFDFAKNNSYKYISSDEVRAEVVGSVSDFNREKEVWDEIRNRVEKSLIDGVDVVLDSTMSKQKDRKSMIDFARQHGAEKIQGVYMDVDLEIAKERNNLRVETKIPDRALDRMYSNLELENPVEVEEGFDSIFVFDENAELKEVRKDFEDHETIREMKIS